VAGDPAPGDGGTGGVLPLNGPLPLSVATATGRRVLLPDLGAAVAAAPQLARAGGVRAWAALPLQVGERRLGALVLHWDRERDFRPEDVDLLDAFAAQCAQGLDRLQVRQAERRAVAASQRFSEALQRTLLTEPPRPEGLSIEVRYQPAAQEAQVGGDWYDAFCVPDGSTLLVVGDVAGHDREAAAMMAQLRNVLRGVAHTVPESPSLVLSALDRALADLRVGALATAVLARVEQSVSDARKGTHVLRWSTAGHPPPLLLLPDGTAQLLDPPPDLLLGLDPTTERGDHARAVPAGSTVLLYTDGLVERRGADIADGIAWLRQAAARHVGLPLDRFCDALLAELPPAVEDDIALLALRTDSVEAPGRAGAEAPGEGSVAADGVDEGTLLVLEPAATAVRAARAHVRARCREAGVDEDVCDTTVLLASEIVTNALIHGRSEARLRVLLTPQAVRVEVGDDNARHPVRVERNDEALDGRGMNILEVLAAAWGVREEPAGKVVWFEVSTMPEGTSVDGAQGGAQDGAGTR
ncbi:SpoIIE family protein phosphatase, partial [Kineococcus glutinatus]